ncbi:MAG TPA: helix-turn-helix domain-containing protein [Acidobacteriota bacterium]|nr:helix-turn-helix domain-containing protein [Acidobacteriota bacterium]
MEASVEMDLSDVPGNGWKGRGGSIERLLSAEETARYLGIKKGTLYVWARSGKIPSVKIGTRLLFDLRDLDELIERQKRAPLPTKVNRVNRQE